MTNQPVFADSAEDHLPPGQEPIETKGVTRLRRFMKLILRSKSRTGYTTMGVVTGRAGIGKTVAIQAFVDQCEPRSYTGLPAVIKVKVKPESTPKALATDVLAALQEKARGRNRYELADEAAAAILRNDVELLIIDEADRLNEATFELLRHIHDKTGCPIVLVGLPDIESVIDRQEKFQSRVGARMKFPVPTRSEVLETILPNLVFPYWTYDPQDESARAMGEHILELVGTSLRRIRKLLTWASQIVAEDLEAEEAKGTVPEDGNHRITLETIDEAITWTPYGEPDENEEEDNQDEVGEHERLSEKRHDAKKKGGKGRR